MCEFCTFQARYILQSDNKMKRKACVNHIAVLLKSIDFKEAWIVKLEE